MRKRDRLISFVFVGAVIGGIWWLGARLRESPGSEDAGDAATEAAPPTAVSASASATTSVASAADAGVGAAADASTPSAACRALDEASKRTLDEARKTRPCTPDPDLSSLGCHTSGKGTWGFRVDEAFEGAMPKPGDACGDTGYLVRLVHVDDHGAEETIVPGLTLSTFGAAPRPYSISTGYRAVRMSDASFFDYDGDGEEEVFVRTTIGTYDRVEQQQSAIFTFGSPDAGKARIVPYAPATSLAIDTTRDADDDGRPDLLVAIGPASAPVGIRLLAHSLPDGTFSLRDAVAVGWAQKQCPQDPKLDLSTKSASDFGQKLADDVACALLWGHDKDLGAGIAKACPRTAEVPAPDSGVCPAWAKALVGTRPAIQLR